MGVGEGGGDGQCCWHQPESEAVVENEPLVEEGSCDLGRVGLKSEGRENSLLWHQRGDRESQEHLAWVERTLEILYHMQ